LTISWPALFVRRPHALPRSARDSNVSSALHCPQRQRCQPSCFFLSLSALR